MSNNKTKLTKIIMLGNGQWQRVFSTPYNRPCEVWITDEELKALDAGAKVRPLVGERGSALCIYKPDSERMADKQCAQCGEWKQEDEIDDEICHHCDINNDMDW